MAISGSISEAEWLIPQPPHEMRPAADHPDPEYERRWKDRVWLRDEGKCSWCRKFEEYVETMEVHHLTYERFGNEQSEDGCLLCGECHAEVTQETRTRRRLSRKENIRNGD